MERIANPTLDIVDAGSQTDDVVVDEIDRALAPSGESSPPEEQGVTRVTKVLRILALIVLLASAATFMFQGWAGWSSVQRVLAFLGFSASLAGTGLLCLIQFNDPKSARVSLGVATAIVPVAFSQIGALVYSLFAPHLRGIPELFLYTAPSASSVGFTLLLGAAVFIPLSFAGFSVLARSVAAPITALYILSNSLLLIPIRDPDFVALLTLGMMCSLACVELLILKGRSELKTFEGNACRVMLYVPVGIVLGRNLALYQTSSLMISALYGIAAAYLFTVLPSAIENKVVGARFQAVSVLPLGLSWGYMVNALFCGPYALIPVESHYLISVYCLPFALMMTGMSFFTLNSGSPYRRFASVLAMLAMILQLTSVPGLISSFLCIFTGVVCIAGACLMEEKVHFYMGALGLTIGLLYHLQYAYQLYNGLGPWLSLAILGTATLISAAYIEKNHGRMVARAKRIKVRLDSWN